jgi:hypothetical protein
MQCHKCEHRAGVEAGRFQGVPFEQTPCATCDFSDTNGISLAFDEGRPGVAEAAPGEAGEGMVEDVHFPEEVPDEDVRLPISVMSEAVAQLLAMPPAVRDVVSWRFADLKFTDIARVQGVTVAAVERRLRHAMEQWPAIRALFAAKAAKQARRKPYGG